MSSKVAALPLVTDHLDTLRDHRTGRRRWQDYAVMYGAPVLIAGLAARLGFRLFDAGQMIAGAAVLSGFSFGLAVYVFQLRLEAHRDPRVSRGDTMLDLIDQLFANVNYSILAGLALVGVSVAGTAFTSDKHLNAWWTAAIVALALHYVLTLLMCLKRLRAAYGRMTI